MPRSVRQVPHEVFWRIALRCLGRMACIYGDPTTEGHDHAECVRDDEAYAADAQLRLLAALGSDDDDLILDRLEDARAAIKRPD